ncbi:hypothetical protein CYMTET_42800 [Cymbomonas tetramitiformis]|uniref:Uncharacterized protein n=1 Tax=Cymbomonas tetramitiformis TaxID=36881 RepID=A0AAE0C4L7_9CHLO|nr:hypothetical protein CYMTET_42800 [Cymbomonas tetramitiformis]
MTESENRGSPAAAVPAHKSRANGVFVYKGSGKIQSHNAPLSQKMCAKKARDVQWCLAKCNQVQAYCKGPIEVMNKCMKKAESLEVEGWYMGEDGKLIRDTSREPPKYT